MIRNATKTALCLAISALASATVARADSGYVPYYSGGQTQNHQYADMAPPLGVAPAPVVVQTQPVRPVELPPTSIFYHLDNEIWAAAGASELNYKESVSPLPDSDRGALPSLAGGINFLTRQNLYLAADGSVSFGNAHYNGALIDTPTVPYETSTHETIANIDAKIGQGVLIQNNLMFTPYADLGFRYWRRDLGDDQDEHYENFDILGGAMLQFAPVDRLLLSVYGAAGTTFASQMHTDGDTYNLGGSAIEKVGGKIGYSLTPQMELFTTIDYDHFHYTASTVLDDDTLEPGSRTEDTTMRVGVGYHFR